MRSRTDFQHTFFALALILLAGLLADLVLWPRDELPGITRVNPGTYFSQSYMRLADSFRGPQAWLTLGAMAMLVLVPLLIALLWPREQSPLRDPLRKGHRRRAALVGAGVATLALTAALPFEFAAFLRSRHYGIAVQSPLGWLGDWLLSSVLVVLVVAALALLTTVLVRRFTRTWWLWLAGFLIALATVFQLLAPVVIAPLFGDFRELPAGQTRNDVQQIARQSGVRAGKILQVDASQRTNGANAYVSGLGSTKRVVIYDTLLKRFDRDQRRAVVAHELGHAHYRDLSAGLIWFAFVTLIAMLAIDLLARVLMRRRNVPIDAPAAIAMIFAAAMVAVALSQPAANAYSRKVEARADAFALQVTRDPLAAIALEQKLTTQNLSRPEPPALLHFLFGTHPTPMQRIGMAETVKVGR